MATEETTPETAPAVEAAEPALVPISKVKDAWTVLATAVNGSRSVNELVTKAGLKGWDVRKEPAFSAVPTGKCAECEQAVGDKHAKGCYLADAEEGETTDGIVDENDTTTDVEIPGYFGVIRTDPKTGAHEAIGATARKAIPVQIEDRASMLTEIAKQTKAKFSAAGPLNENTAAFVSLKMPELIKVAKGSRGVKADELEMRLVLICSPVPGQQSEIRFSAVRPKSATVQHFPIEPLLLEGDSTVDTRLTESSEAVARVQSVMEELSGTASKMMGQKMSLKEFNELCFQLWIRPQETANTWLKNQHEARTAVLRALFLGQYDLFEGIGNTRWAAWQAVQTVAEHMPHVENKADDKEAELRRRAEQALFGANAKAGGRVSAKAFGLLTD
ncbi:DUF932 domain-containing protein [Amycolatopsis sp. NPDC051716]|uniref:DUF932 domain-containing protein n=1 Tax=Amycolatopsis sp. NPDC051716 TaxID=3155804 RepID=UPI003436BCF0